MYLISRLPPWARALLVALALLATARALALVLHRPLLAFTNNDDHVRYTACLDLAPRQPGVAADAGNPQAPPSRHAFQPLPRGTCIWTSDLMCTAPVAQTWSLSDVLGAHAIYSVRHLAEWRPLLLFIFALFGDGDFEYTKHAQLAINFSLAGLGVPFAALARLALPAHLRA